jgi:beta-phosphoglucomutase-like phosphatase (HAD superfamily)
VSWCTTGKLDSPTAAPAISGAAERLRALASGDLSACASSSSSVGATKKIVAHILS